MLTCLKLVGQHDYSVSRVPFDLGPYDYINSITQDSSGYVWFHLLMGKLLRTNGYSIKEYPYTIDYRNIMSDLNIQSELVVDENKIIWITCARGIIAFNSSIGSYQYFANENFGLSDYQYKFSGIVKIAPNKLLAISEDINYVIDYKIDGNIITISNFYPDTTGIDFHVRKKVSPEEIELIAEELSLGTTDINAFMKDADGVIWICVSGNIVYKLVPDNGTIKTIGEKREIDHWSMFFNSNNFLFKNGYYYQLIEKNINVIDDNGVITRKINIRKTGNDFASYNDLILIADSSGLYGISPSTGKLSVDKETESLFSFFRGKNLKKLWVDDENTIWLLDVNNIIYRAVNIDNQWSVKTVFRGLNFEMSFMDLDLRKYEGQTMMISVSEGVFLYSEEEETFLPFNDIIEQPFSSSVITSYCIDSFGNEWFGTGAGIWRYIKSEEKYEKFDGASNEIFFSLISDNTGHIWGTTANRLFVIDEQKNSLAYITSLEGEETFNFQSGGLLDNGKLFFLCKNGEVCLIDPLKYPSPRTLHKLAITSLTINSEPFESWLASLPPNGKHRGKTSLILQNYENNIGLEFTGLEYFDQENIKYKYKLQGFERNWRFGDSKNREVYYPNLPPGKYKFVVSASYSDINVNYTEAIFPFAISPPWWKSTTAYVFYGLIFISITIWFWRYSIERIKMRERVKRAEEKLKYEKELNEFKLDFFTEISHEFKTPLTIISGYINRLAENSLTVKKRVDALSTIKRNIERLLSLVSQIVDVRKIGGDKFNTHPEKADIVEFVRKFLMDFDQLAKSKGLEFNFKGPMELVVWFDKSIVEKIILNLLSNAFKFTNNGKIEVGLASGTDVIIISVSDTGVGISEKDLPKIFERFYRSDNSIKNRYEGSGVGLTLVKELVDSLKGTIEVFSNTETETKFVVTLPSVAPSISNQEIVSQNNETNFVLDLPDAQEDEKSIENTVDNAKKQTDFQTMLVVEDNADMARFVSELFTPLMKVVLTSNGKEGLVTAIKLMPDIVISDIMMPEMNGIEFLEKLKTNINISHIPVVMLTAKSLINDQIKGLETGADAYVAKPFNDQYLKAVVLNLLESRQQLRERWNSNVMKLTAEEYAITNADHHFMESVLEIIDSNIGNAGFRVEDIFKNIGMGHANFFKKIKYLTDQSPLDIIKTRRMERAAMLLKEKNMRVSDVCYAVGFSDPKYFYKVFKEHFGVAPSSL